MQININNQTITTISQTLDLNLRFINSEETSVNLKVIKRKILKCKTKKLKKEKKAKLLQNSIQYKHSLWELTQNLAYSNFLTHNQYLFRSNRLQKRLMKINVLMSQEVKTRSPDQCRSHHQKMMHYHHSIPNIIKHIDDLSKMIWDEEEMKIEGAQLQIKQIKGQNEFKEYMEQPQQESFCDRLLNNCWWDSFENDIC